MKPQWYGLKVNGFLYYVQEFLERPDGFRWALNNGFDMRTKKRIEVVELTITEKGANK